jgi:hypothetical protein
MALWNNDFVNRILMMEGVCFISISGALVDNVLAPATKKKTIFKTSETRGRKLRVARASPTHAFALVVIPLIRAISSPFYFPSLLNNVRFGLLIRPISVPPVSMTTFRPMNES